MLYVCYQNSFAHNSTNDKEYVWNQTNIKKSYGYIEDGYTVPIVSKQPVVCVYVPPPLLPLIL